MKLYTYCRYTYLPVVQDHTPKNTNSHTQPEIFYDRVIYMKMATELLNKKKNKEKTITMFLTELGLEIDS